MAMEIVIDGYNLIGVTDGMDKGADIEALREALIARLSVYKRARKIDITVVFDAMHQGALGRKTERRGGIDAVFSKAGEEADTIIKEAARRRGKGLTVVTSDGAVRRECEASGAVVVSSEEFAEALSFAEYAETKGITGGGEEDAVRREKKGEGKKLPKKERKKLKRLKKL